MAYSNTGRPRFFINLLEWSDSLPSDTFRTLPVDPQVQEDDSIEWATPLLGMTEYGFIAVLGHNLHEVEGVYSVYEDQVQVNFTGTVEVNRSGNNTVPEYNGYSINTFTGSEDVSRIQITNDPSIGSIVLGTYYTMPHSPELKLTMTREMDGVKRTRTKGGFDLVDHKYTKSPLWGSLAPWEIGGSINQKLSRVGRRSWDLSFNSLDGSDVFGSNQSLSSDAWALEIADETPPASSFGDDIHTGNNNFIYNILTDDNFYSQVIHKTNGGQLPFIFQPDSDYLNNFAICKFDMKKFSYTQTSFNSYQIKLRIKEVW